MRSMIDDRRQSTILEAWGFPQKELETGYVARIVCTVVKFVETSKCTVNKQGFQRWMGTMLILYITGLLNVPYCVIYYIVIYHIS